MFSHAEGCETSAFGYGSHAAGVKARSDDKHSYTWNGDSANEYGSHGEGTFNISALNGLDGIYIGDKTLK